jgi:hypothetical protein
MSKAVLLIELGWEPINDFLNRQRASYLSYINNLPNKTLCKRVFDEMHALSAHVWDYIPALKTKFHNNVKLKVGELNSITRLRTQHV